MDEPLTIPELAKVARDLLEKDKGFTIDEFGEAPDLGPMWAISMEGKKRKFTWGVFGETLEHGLIASFLQAHPPGQTYFGGWIDDDGTCYLDHTLLTGHKHTAIQMAIENKQKAIYNLGTGETLTIPEQEGDTPRSLVANSNVN